MEAMKYIFSTGPALGSILPHILLPISMIIGLASPQFKGRGLVWSAIIVYLVYLTIVDKFPADKQLRYALFTSWLWYVVTLQKLLTSVPEKAYWRLDRQPEEATHMQFGLGKIQWAISLWLNPRGVGWNYQIKRLLPPKYLNNQRVQFILGQSLNFLLFYLMVDAAMLYLSTFSFPRILDDLTWIHYILIGIDFGILTYALWQMQWHMVSIFGVATGLSQPEVCTIYQA